MNRLSFLLLLLGACASLVAAASAPTFCKCTCFTNSTIIEIKSTTAGASPRAHVLAESQSQPPLEPPNSNPLHSRAAPKRATASSPSCSQCNRAFCLTQSLPICKGAEEKDVATMCFQRESRKDQIIVWGFILGTAGLLGWAGLKKVWEMRVNSSGGGGGMIAGALLRGGGGGGVLPVASVGGGGAASGNDGGRGQYATVAVHSRDNSVL